MRKFNKYKHAERCLYDYHINLTFLQQKQWDIQHIALLGDSIPENDRVDTSKISSPVENKAQTLDNLSNKVMELTIRTEPITRLVEYYQKHAHTLWRILDNVYFQKEPISRVGEILGFSRKSVYSMRIDIMQHVMNALPETSTLGREYRPGDFKTLEGYYPFITHSLPNPYTDIQK